MIEVLQPGLLTTVQDLGRTGYRASGLAVAGAMDGRALRLANLLVGNRPGAAALELTLSGGRLRFLRAGVVALAGAPFVAAVDGAPVTVPGSFTVREGSELTLGPPPRGVRAYLAVPGGVEVPVVLGSRSTDLRAGLGGHHGRALRRGDLVPWAGESGPPPRRRSLPAALVPDLIGEGRLRILWGPQDDHFSGAERERFVRQPWQVTNRNDRAGYHLEGQPLVHLRGPGIVSDGLCPGSVQVPGTGLPVVLTADAQTVGGYAKIATVIGPDLPRLAQARRGDALGFVPVSEADAVEARRVEQRWLESLADALGVSLEG